jgi:hypothetical protein
MLYFLTLLIRQKFRYYKVGDTILVSMDSKNRIIVIMVKLNSFFIDVKIDFI